MALNVPAQPCPFLERKSDPCSPQACQNGQSRSRKTWSGTPSLGLDFMRPTIVSPAYYCRPDSRCAYSCNRSTIVTTPAKQSPQAAKKSEVENPDWSLLCLTWQMSQTCDGFRTAEMFINAIRPGSDLPFDPNWLVAPIFGSHLIESVSSYQMKGTSPSLRLLEAC